MYEEAQLPRGIVRPLKVTQDIYTIAWTNTIHSSAPPPSSPWGSRQPWPRDGMAQFIADGRKGKGTAQDRNDPRVLVETVNVLNDLSSFVIFSEVPIEEHSKLSWNNY